MRCDVVSSESEVAGEYDAAMINAVALRSDMSPGVLIIAVAIVGLDVITVSEGTVSVGSAIKVKLDVISLVVTESEDHNHMSPKRLQCKRIRGAE